MRYLIIFLMFCSTTFGSLQFTSDIVPGASFDEMMAFDNIGVSDACDLALFYGLYGSGDNGDNVLQQIKIGEANQFFRVNGGGNGYSWDTLDYSDMNFTGWTGVNSITTLGTIGAGVWQGTAINSTYLVDVDQDLQTSASPTFAGIIFGANPSVITSAYIIDIKPGGVLKVHEPGASGEYIGFGIGGGADISYYGSLGNEHITFQKTGDTDATFFENSSAAETPELKIYGNRLLDTLRSLEIGVGVDAADTASFDGLSNYLFHGNIAADNFSGTNTGDDDVPESGDFGAAVDLDADGSVSAGAVALGTDTTGNYAAGDGEAGNLQADTWKSADGNKSVDWGSAAAGSLVLDGDDGDDMDVDGVEDNIDETRGTITAWFKFTDPCDGLWNPVVWFETTSTNDHQIRFGKGADNDFHATYRASDVNYDAEDIVVSSMGSWTFGAMTWNTAGNVILYLDDPGDGPDASTAISGVIPADAMEGAEIGGRPEDVATQQARGEISDVIIWSDDLSQAECKAVFDLGRNPTQAALLEGIANEAEILHSWPLTENENDDYGSAADIDGTLNGSIYIKTTAVTGLNETVPHLISNNLTVDGSLRVTGTITADGQQNVRGNLNVLGVIDADGNIDLNSASGTTIAQTVPDQKILVTLNNGGVTETVLTFDSSLGVIIFESSATIDPLFEGGFYVGGSSPSSGRHFDNSPDGTTSTNIYIGDEIIDTSVSDERLKINIERSSLNALETLKTLNIVDFDWKEPTKRKGRMTGLLAQELYQLYPQYVRKGEIHTDPNGIQTENTWAIRYNSMVPLLMKAVIELSAKNDIQDGTIQILQMQVADLIKRIKILEDVQPIQ